jgi:hypothetical protein
MIANVPVRVMMMPENDVTATAVAAANHTHSAAAAVHSATTVHSTTATAAVTASAGFRRTKHCKAERSTRGDGQNCGFTKHDTLLSDPLGDR